MENIESQPSQPSEESSSLIVEINKAKLANIESDPGNQSGISLGRNLEENIQNEIKFNKVDSSYEKNESLPHEASKLFNKIQQDSKQKKRLDEIISYLKVQKKPFDPNELGKIFDRLDMDGNNAISRDELKRFLISLKTPINDYYIEKIISEFDSNRDGDISKKEFLDKMKSHQYKGNTSDLTELLEIFKLFDANHDNKICDQDLQNILLALGENFEQETCREMMKYLGGEDGKINFSQFFELVKDEGNKEESYI